MAQLDGLQILVVEDNHVLREGIIRILRQAGAAPTGVGSGEGALELVGAGWRFDIVLMDLGLPGMDGARCAHLLRALPRSSREEGVRTIVGMSGDPERLFAERSAFDSALEKPFTPNTLVDALSLPRGE